MAKHELKTDPDVFQAVWMEHKTYEIRFDDRDFEKADWLTLKETKYTGEEMMKGSPLIYTGREVDVVVMHKLKGMYGIKDGWCILSFHEMDRRDC